jgi:hypothetical protein
MRDELDAAISEYMMPIEGDIFIDMHLTQIFRIVLSGDKLGCIVERDHRVLNKLYNSVSSSMQMQYDVFQYVLKVFYFTFEIVLII